MAIEVWILIGVRSRDEARRAGTMLAGGVSHRYRKNGFTEAWKAGTMELPVHSKPGHCVGPLGLEYSFEPTPVADATGRHSTGPPGLRHFAPPAYPNPIVGVSDVTINS
ncbi:hypothetical protein CKO51_20720 [Rhodopirellula sp. SM50]|nr:hypothetical protein CKO51_20720 [Rhodopirellula sp. SM50]